MIKMVAATCPNCSANLQFEESRREGFCSYCGAKILLHNDNEKIIRNIDEADLERARAEADYYKRKLEIEAEEKRREDKRKSRENIAELIFCSAFLVLCILFFVIMVRTAM